MTAAMLLYHDTRAPNPRRVRIFLAEKGVAYDTIEVSIAAAEHQKPEFRKKNPLALLPVPFLVGEGEWPAHARAFERRRRRRRRAGPHEEADQQRDDIEKARSAFVHDSPSHALLRRKDQVE